MAAIEEQAQQDLPGTPRQGDPQIAGHRVPAVQEGALAQGRGEQPARQILGQHQPPRSLRRDQARQCGWRGGQDFRQGSERGEQLGRFPILQAGGERWEQKLINQLGPVELWALSTTPDDTALLRRVQERVGFSEALRRLSKVFPGGSAQKVIDRRKEERTRRGEQDEVAAVSVIEDLTREVVDGVGLGIVLRPHDARPAAPLALAAE